MLRTLLATVVLAWLGWLSAAWLTQDFEIWTAEGARRRSVIDAPVTAPHATLLGAGVNGVDLVSALAQPGRVTIASFIYTRCPSICLSLGSSFQQLQDAIAAPPSPGLNPSVDLGVRLLSLSFDPAHDNADQLSRYASQLRVNPQYWTIATVPDAEQLQRLLRAWQVVVIADGLGGYEHNAALLVIDAHGRLVRIFEDSEGVTALAYARALQQLDAAKFKS